MYIVSRSEFVGRLIEFTVTLTGHDKVVGNNVSLLDG